MRKLLKIWFLLLIFSAATSVNAQSAPKCTEYKVTQAPVQCGPGYTGMKVPVTTYTCPSKNPVLSYDTTGCVPVGTPPKNPLATNCSVTPGDAECMPLPKPSGCPAGKHWTTQGSGVAHCVGDDINCPFGTSLAHDFLGNPVCNPNTCPGNQVLQADGKTCACPSGTSWNGSSCIAIPVVCPAPKVSMKACPAGMTGKILVSTTYSLPNCTEEKTEDFSQCKNAECPGPSTSYSACPAGYSGSILTTTSFIGPSCTAVTNTTDGCKLQKPTCPADSQQTTACPTGFSGTALLKTTYDQNNNCSQTDSVDNSGCKPVKPQYWHITVGESLPALGVIGSAELCRQNGYGYIINVGGNTFGSGALCLPESSPGSDHNYFSFVPRSSIDWFAANTNPNLGDEPFMNCILYGNDPATGYNCWYISNFRNSYMQLQNEKALFIGGPSLYTISAYTPNSPSAYVRKGDVMGYFWSEERVVEIYAPDDGYLFIGSFCRCGD